MNAILSWTDGLLRVSAAHLLETTVVAVVALALCVMFRRYHAGVTAAILTAASAKFLVPFGLLAAAGASLPWPPAPVPHQLTTTVTAAVAALPATGNEDLASPTAPSAADTQSAGTARSATLPLLLVAVWAAGAIVLLGRRLAAVAAAAAIRRRSRPLDVGRAADAFARIRSAHGPVLLQVRATSECGTPCVVGVWRPVLLWPDGIADALTDAQLDAIVAHEVAHVRRRDNLIAAMHALVEIVFWFHPLVWLIGARLADARERACDEHVIASGARPDHYADGILKVCERALAAPAAAAGIAGFPLTRRIEAIMTAHAPHPLDHFRRALLAGAAFSLIALPVAAGALTKPPVPAEPAVQAGDGRITGAVTDQTGGYMPGVTITAKSTSGVERTATTDDAGRYAIALPAGMYDLQFARSAFKTRRVSGVTVRSGLATAVDAQLEIGALVESLTTTAPAGGTQDVDTAALLARESDLVRQLGLTPYEPSLHRELAHVYYRLERYDDSEVAMQRAVDLIAQQPTERQRDFVVTLPRGGDVREPKKIRDVKPIYPAIAQTARVDGTVILEARIAQDGTVHDVRVLRSVPLLDAAAVGAVRQWQFTPTLLNGVPVEVIMTATVNFTLR